MLKFRFSKNLLLSLVLLSGVPLTAGAHTTLLIPSQTSIEEKTAQAPLPEKDARSAAAEKKDGQAQQKAAPSAAESAQAAKAGSAKDASPEKAPAPGREAKGAAEKKDRAQGKPGQQPAQPAEAQTPSQSPAGTEANPLPAKPAPSIGDTVASVNSSILACASPESINQEVDMLIAGMDLFRHEGLDMDMPRIFTVYRFDPEARDRDRPCSATSRKSATSAEKPGARTSASAAAASISSPLRRAPGGTRPGRVTSSRSSKPCCPSTARTGAGISLWA